MSKYWSKIVSGLSPYIPGEQPRLNKLIKLNTNENPYGPSPQVARVCRNFDTDRLRLYPDPEARELKQLIASYFNVGTANVFLGNGSDEVLAHTFHGLLQQAQPVLMPDITYSFYPVYCRLYGVAAKTIALDAGLGIHLPDYCQPNGGIIFPNPNAPTGRAVPLADIEALLQANAESVVVVDEAYIDFGGESAVRLVPHYPNLLVIQTLSKSRSLAGLRVGFAIGAEALIEGLERIKNSFNSYPLGFYAQQAAIASFNDEAYFQATTARIQHTRKSMSEGLQALGFSVLPSAANFVFTTHPNHNAADLFAQLRQHNIIVRYFNKPRISQYLRITVGTDSQAEALLRALRLIVGSA